MPAAPQRRVARGKTAGTGKTGAGRRRTPPAGSQNDDGGGLDEIDRLAAAGWAAAAARARRELAANADAIDDTPRGTPGAKPATWRRGQSPGTLPPPGVRQ